MAVPVQRFFTGRTFLRQKHPLAIHNWWPGDIFVLILFFHFIPFIRTCHTILAGALGNSHTAQRGLPELRWDGTSHGVHDPNGLVDGRNALTPARESSAEISALEAPMAFRFWQGFSTRPPMGSQTRPRILTMAKEAASMQLPRKYLQKAPQPPMQPWRWPDPTSAWQPPLLPLWWRFW